MQTPTYEYRRVGGEYVSVRKDVRSTIDRVATITGGALLAHMGLKHHRLLRLVVIAAGAELICRGITGMSLVRVMGFNCCQGGQDESSSQAPSYQNDRVGRASQKPSDVVDEQSMESFPASDAPARTVSTSVG